MYKVIEFLPRKRKYLIKITDSLKIEEFLVTDELILEFRLVKGKELDKETYLRFIENYKRDEFYQKVLHYALYKQRCLSEINKYLDKLKIPKSNRGFYLNKLKKNQILNEKSYTENYIFEYFEYKKQGINKIIYNLEKKQINKSLYYPIIKKIPNSKIQENIEFLYYKKIKSIKNKSLNRAVEDIKKFIINKGYNYALVNSFVNNKRSELEKNISENLSLEKDYNYAIKKYNKNKSKEFSNILSYLLRKGYTYNKIKVIMDKGRENE